MNEEEILSLFYTRIQPQEKIMNFPQAGPSGSHRLHNTALPRSMTQQSGDCSTVGHTEYPLLQPSQPPWVAGTAVKPISQMREWRPRATRVNTTRKAEVGKHMPIRHTKPPLRPQKRRGHTGLQGANLMVENQKELRFSGTLGKHMSTNASLALVRNSLLSPKICQKTWYFKNFI